MQSLSEINSLHDPVPFVRYRTNISKTTVELKSYLTKIRLTFLTIEYGQITERFQLPKIVLFGLKSAVEIL
ncbi:hypothetical protein CBM2592_B100197 [Cupriavidus taiwanensis]|nr:hypothetical protein CBM2588_B100047 [Cupriavidus taiwanensis]SOY61489.1 hypothetical protein CBM2592_B100197 [Cupriavidus taiwanensis]SOY97983.1 hypothetical protein CBM2591_B80198 [Cupriavidus taiwanensis]SOZ84904.1 hypothetical protein CBM2618_B120007 [Cupriavidus taiwanensis]SOZ88132.1 hypothetical protein CBM2622_B130007 [Cupriavidus taiwanensis]